ncbi:MAG TPA: UDP-2,3-diacylglucosamine diphosphatase LpxI [Terriglobia bacterium]|nr:UDP-2,3-diacylglucosamine diphosphatase LpxI [Terriglobia bacterium]
MTEESTKTGIHAAGGAALEPSTATAASDRYAIIAGNGRFPFLVLDAAHDRRVEPLVVAIKEEAFPELGKKAREIEWLSLGEVARLLELLTERGVNKVVLAGQVKHVQLFSSIKPDGVVERTLNGMERKNTDALIGAFVGMLEARGIQVVDSTLFLKPLLADAGVMTERAPDESELADIAYGREIAKTIAGLDIGQTIVVADRACVAIEAMEGTDAAIERAASLGNGKRLVVVKVSKPQQDMRFDVPVAGVRTIRVMKRANAQVLAVDAGRTLLFERQQLIREANEAGIAVVGMND